MSATAILAISMLVEFLMYSLALTMYITKEFPTTATIKTITDHSPEYCNDETSGWWWLCPSCCTYPMAAAHIRVFLFWRHLPLSCMKNTWVRLGRQTHTRRCFEPQPNWPCWCLNRKTFLPLYSSSTFRLRTLDRDLCLKRSGLCYNLSQRKWFCHLHSSADRYYLFKLSKIWNKT